jgi:hypothetical protein
MKKVAIGLAGLILIAGLGLGYLWTNLDSLVKAAIEKYGTAAAGVTVSLDSVKLTPAAGEGLLKGLNVDSPKGFSAPKAFNVGTASVKMDIASLRGDGPIVIDDVTVDGPQVMYEATANGDSNLQTIARHAQSYAVAADSAPSTVRGKPVRKIIIRHLTIRNGHISITQPLLQGHPLEASLPLIRLTDIGGKDGATPAEAAQQIVKSVTTTVSQVAASSLIKQFGNIRNAPGAVIEGAEGGLKGITKSLLGK